jgi:protein TonB
MSVAAAITPGPAANNSSSATVDPDVTPDSSTQPAPPAPAPADAHAATAAPEPKAEARTKGSVSGGVLNSKALSLPLPVYPASARSAGASGKVVVEVTINEEGKVVEARAVSGHPMLQQAAVQAARLARFKPAMLSGQPVKVTGTISYTFVWQ